MKVTFERPTHGWLSLTFESGSSTFSEVISNVPYAACLGELATGLLMLWRKPTPLVLRWNTEPVEYELRFVPIDGDRLMVEVFRFITRRLSAKDCVFAASESRRDVCLVFWRALRRLESTLTPEDIQTHWPRFPKDEIAALTSEIRASKASE